MADIITIDLWLWRLDMDAAEIARLEPLLSADERTRAERFYAPAHRASYIAGRGRLREILGTEIQKPAADIQFRYGAAGKPELANAAKPLQFNLSHTGPFAALVTTPGHPLGVDLGVDIEQMRPMREEIARRFFAPAEAAAIAALPADEQTAAFHRCWTRKEAFVKAVGAGLGFALQSFEVSVDAASPPAVLNISGATGDEAACWQLLHFEPAEGVAGAIAVRLPAPGMQMVLRHRSGSGLSLSPDLPCNLIKPI